MNTIKKIIYGENARKTLEGASSNDILEIVNSVNLPVESSPYAKVLGVHLAAENETTKGYKEVKVKLRRSRS